MSLKARNYLKFFSLGGKLGPEDIAGMIGLPYVGKIIYVDPTGGSNSNNGSSLESAVATVAAGYALATSGKHDVIMIVPTGGTGRTTETASITWAKRFTHLIGNAAPTGISQRAGLGFSSAVTSPCITVSENGCIFKNLTFATTEDINVMMSVTGDRNYFENCHIQGSTNDTAGDDATWRALSLSGAEENTFVGCTIGVDTFNRSAANANLELASASTRNVFRGCFFPSFADNAGVLWVKAASAADVDRFVHFDNCVFHNAIRSSATAMTVGMSIHAAVGGTFLMNNSWWLGATDLASDVTNVYTNNNVQDTNDQGVFLVHANS